MKKFLLWMVFLTICPFVWAQSFQISQNSYQKVSVSFTPGTLSVENISVPEGELQPPPPPIVENKEPDYYENTDNGFDDSSITD